MQELTGHLESAVKEIEEAAWEQPVVVSLVANGQDVVDPAPRL
jgi:hypothetical protein